MLEDRDLEVRFRARATRAPGPPATLLLQTMKRIDEAPQHLRGGSWFASTMWRWAGMTVLAAGALAVALSYPGMNGANVPERVPLGLVQHVPAGVPKSMERRVPQRGIAAGPTEPIARSASLGLAVPDIETALHALDAIARRNGGLVTYLQDFVPPGEGAPHFASATLVVNQDRFQPALDQVAALGEQRTRSVNAEALGESIAGDEAQLRDLRREETELLHLMDRSGSIDDGFDVETQLTTVRRQIESLQTALTSSAHRIRTAEITVNLTETRPDRSVAVTFGDGAAATWQAASRVSLAMANALLDGAIWLVALAPFFLPVALIAAVLVIRARPRF